jgi:hypothetical protein
MRLLYDERRALFSTSRACSSSANSAPRSQERSSIDKLLVAAPDRRRRHRHRPWVRARVRAGSAGTTGNPLPVPTLPSGPQYAARWHHVRTAAALFVASLF